MAITATLVKELRELTGAGMMDCKKALQECDGDLEEAKLFLQKKGIADSKKRVGRIASEGLVEARVSECGKHAVLVEVNCETDFVARNQEFVGFVDEVIGRIMADRLPSLEAVVEVQWDGKAYDEYILSQAAKTGEKIQVRRVSWVHVPEGKSGRVGSYIHAGGKIGVIVALTTASDDDANSEAFDRLAKDIAMHIAASDPLVVSAGELDEGVIAEKKEIFTGQAGETGKPANIVEKIVLGKLAKWKKEVSLVNQPFVKDMDVSIEQHIARESKESFSGPAQVVAFVRFLLGEGIEKKKANLAEEIAALQK